MTAVTVWWARRQDARPELTALLDGAERERFTSYLHEPSRERFLVGCALAKSAVAAVRGTSAAEVTLDRTCPGCGQPHGKPRVHGDLELSVSHSGDRVVVAVARTTPIGVDVEEANGRVRGGDDPGAMERYVLSETELAAFAAELERGLDRRRNFLVVWTRKEAVLKATGDGLNVPLHDLVVAAPAAPPEVLAWPYPDPPDRVALLDLDVGPAYVAALAVLGRCDEVISQDGTALLAAAITR